MRPLRSNMVANFCTIYLCRVLELINKSYACAICNSKKF